MQAYVMRMARIHGLLKLKQHATVFVTFLKSTRAVWLEVTPAGKRKGKSKSKDDEDEEESAGSAGGVPIVALAFKTYLFEREK